MLSVCSTNAFFIIRPFGNSVRLLKSSKLRTIGAILNYQFCPQRKIWAWSRAMIPDVLLAMTNAMRQGINAYYRVILLYTFGLSKGALHILR